MAKKKTTKKRPKSGSLKASNRVAYGASLYCSEQKGLPKEFVEKVRELETALDKTIWLVVQASNDSGETGLISEELSEMFVSAKKDIGNKPIALLINSPGGYARPAFRIAELLRRQCGYFDAIVPRLAKSASTLLSLGAREIIMGDDAELGPLDAQVYDPEREEQLSALDEVQAVESLENAAMEAADTLLFLMKQRTGKKLQTLMPDVLHFAAEIKKPLFDKIDTVRYSQMSRALKVGEEYAYRLLAPTCGGKNARKIAQMLVSDYPEHAFTINREESAKVGLSAPEPADNIKDILSDIYPFLAAYATRKPAGFSAVGKITEHRLQ